MKAEKEFDKYDEATSFKKSLNKKGQYAWIDTGKRKKYSVHYYKL